MTPEQTKEHETELHALDDADLDAVAGGIIAILIGLLASTSEWR